VENSNDSPTKRMERPLQLGGGRWEQKGWPGFHDGTSSLAKLKKNKRMEENVEKEDGESEQVGASFLLSEQGGKKGVVK